MNPIRTAPEFRTAVLQLIDEKQSSSRSLEEYLLALLHQLQSLRESQPTYQDIATILRNSYDGKLAEFSDDWKNLPWYTTTPNSKEYHQEIRTFECQERQLKIRISGLRQLAMDGKLRQDSSKLWLNGADDYRGSRWYNFTVDAFLERGTTLFENIEVGEENYEELDGWIDFGFIMSDGASYE